MEKPKSELANFPRKNFFDELRIDCLDNILVLTTAALCSLALYGTISRASEYSARNPAAIYYSK